MKDDFVSTEHFLLALAAPSPPPQTPCAAPAPPRRPSSRRSSPCAATSASPIRTPRASTRRSRSYTRDLTQPAHQGKLDPVIGRDQEIRRAIQVAVAPHQEQPRARSASPASARPPIVEGIALRIAAGDVPESPKRQARLLARPGRADRGHQVPRRIRGAPQGRAQGDRRPPAATSSCSSTSCTPWSAPAPPRARCDAGEPAQARARPRRAALRRRHHARRVPQAHREGRGARAPLPARLRRASPASRTPSPSSAASRTSYEAHHRHPDHATPRSSPPPGSPTATSRDRFLPDKAIDLVDEAASRLKMEIEMRAHRRSTSSSGAPATARDRAQAAARARTNAHSEQAPARARARDRRAAEEQMPASDAPSGSAESDLEIAGQLRSGEEQRLDQLRDAERHQQAGRLRAASSSSTAQSRGSRSELDGTAAGRGSRAPGAASSARRSPTTKSPRWSPTWTGIPRRPACSKPSATSCSCMEDACTSAWSARTKPSAPWPTRSAARAPACRIRTGRSARSCSSAPPASARPSCARRSPSSCSTTSTPWSAST